MRQRAVWYPPSIYLCSSEEPRSAAYDFKTNDRIVRQRKVQSSVWKQRCNALERLNEVNENRLKAVVIVDSIHFNREGDKQVDSNNDIQDQENPEKHTRPEAYIYDTKRKLWPSLTSVFI